MLFITGITGLTGRFLLNCLREVGYVGPIRCLIRKHSDVSWIADKDVELYVGDVGNAECLKTALVGVKSVIHLVNIRFSPQIIQACHESEVKRVIFVTTTGIFSKFQRLSDEYRQLENDIKESELEYTIIRPTMIYGNQLDKNIHKLVRIVDKYPVIPIIGSGKVLMQPIYARDLATTIAKAYIHPVSVGKSYNVAGKYPVKYGEMMTLIAALLGKKRIFIRIPYSIALPAGYIGEKLHNSLIDIEKVKRLTEDKVFSYDEAAKDLGFSPIPLEEGISLEVAALRKSWLIRSS